MLIRTSHLTSVMCVLYKDIIYYTHISYTQSTLANFIHLTQKSFGTDETSRRKWKMVNYYILPYKLHNLYMAHEITMCYALWIM